MCVCEAAVEPCEACACGAGATVDDGYEYDGYEYDQAPQPTSFFYN